MESSEMKKVDIVNARVLTALGDLDQTWDSIMSNKSGLKQLINSNLAPDTFYGAIETIPRDLESLGRLHQLLDICLGDALLFPEGTAIVLSTTKAAADELVTNKEISSLQGQPWNIDHYIRQKLGNKTPITTISAACASGTLAIIHGMMSITSGKSKFVLVIGIDVLSTFVSIGFSKLKALSEKRCKPFDTNRDGLSLGEGFGAILLASSEATEKFKFKPLAHVMGWGSSCDASHITAPSRTANGLIASIKQAIKGRENKIGAINAHGTGTNFNDAMEAYAFHEIWDEIPPIHSVKGALGHCLGAAGVIETAIALKSLETGMIPPTVGTQTPEKLINKSVVVEKSRELQYPSILKCNSGFGGINAAIFLTN
jgi:3-oxoacyl-(acyl-carrier-protein) synthase